MGSHKHVRFVVDGKHICTCGGNEVYNKYRYHIDTRLPRKVTNIIPKNDKKLHKVVLVFVKRTRGHQRAIEWYATYLYYRGIKIFTMLSWHDKRQLYHHNDTKYHEDADNFDIMKANPMFVPYIEKMMKTVDNKFHGITGPGVILT